MPALPRLVEVSVVLAQHDAHVKPRRITGMRRRIYLRLGHICGVSGGGWRLGGAGRSRCDRQQKSQHRDRCWHSRVWCSDREGEASESILRIFSKCSDHVYRVRRAEAIGWLGSGRGIV